MWLISIISKMTYTIKIYMYMYKLMAPCERGGQLNCYFIHFVVLWSHIAFQMAVSDGTTLSKAYDHAQSWFLDQIQNKFAQLGSRIPFIHISYLEIVTLGP